MSQQGFRDSEKSRLVLLKATLFGSAASGGQYKGKLREFCLPENRSAENLEENVRDGALRYFSARKIPWHDGHQCVRPKDRPSNHLCCSQTFCVNALYPFRYEPNALARFLRALGYDVCEVLPLSLDRVDEESEGYVGFEWIGVKNYLGEFSTERTAPDSRRNRGAGSTSADFIVRFLRTDGRIQLVLGEWKYTELYPRGRNLQISRSGKDRMNIYGPHLKATDCQLVLQNVDARDLFYDPFDQLMRLQLLASAMMREREMNADLVTVMHVAPRANWQLMERITSPSLTGLGKTIHEVWSRLVLGGFFTGITTEQLLDAALTAAPISGWKSYMRHRYTWTPE